MMLQRIRRRLRDSAFTGESERGVTLTELIVAIGIFGIAATLIVTTVVTFNRTFTRDQAATSSTNIASMGMNEVTKLIRSGTSIPVPNVVVNTPVFEKADRENVIFHSYVSDTSSNLSPVKVQFTVDSNRNLVERRWAASQYSSAFPSYWRFPASTTTPSTSRVIAKTIAAPDQTDPDPVKRDKYMFTFYEISATTQQEVEMVVPSGGIAAADLKKIAVVEVTLKVQADAFERAEPVTITNRVGIPNLDMPRVGI